jgi:hypothetical protein
VTDRLRWPAAVAASALVLDLLALGSIHGPVRLLVTLWFLLVCTGMSFVPLLALPSFAIQLLVGVLMSLALDTIVATTIVEIGGLSTESALIVLEAVCLAGCAVQLGAWGREVRWRS